MTNRRPKVDLSKQPVEAAPRRGMSLTWQVLLITGLVVLYRMWPLW